MITAIIIFTLSAIYAFKEYAESNSKKDLWFGIILFASAGWTFWQTLGNDEDTNLIKQQTANTQRLGELDSTFSLHLDTLAQIDTSMSAHTSTLVEQVYRLTKQNISLSDSIRLLVNDVNTLTQTTSSLVKQLDVKTDEEFAVSGTFNLKFSHILHDNDRILFQLGSNTFNSPAGYFKTSNPILDLLNMYNYDPFQLTVEENKVLLSCKIYDLDSNLLAEVQNNNWRVNKNMISKFNFDDAGVEIFNNKGQIAFSINILNPNILQIQGIVPDFKSKLIGIMTANGNTEVEPIKYFQRSIIDSAVASGSFKQLFQYTGNHWHGVRNK